MFGTKENIVISVGDDGAIITRFKSGKLVKRAFTNSPFSSEFKDFVKGSEEASIYLLLDNVDQNYIFSSLPSSVSNKNQLKIVKRKLQNEFDKNDLNAYLNLGKEEPTGKKGIRYVFLSVRNANPLSDWLEAIYELPNPFSGIYLLPIESEDFTSKLFKLNNPNIGKKDEVERWQVLIAHNRVGGFRQVVYKNGRIIFTRISQSPSLQSPDAIGSNITQESSNTLEYIRRIGYTDQPISVYIITTKDAFQFVEVAGISTRDIFFYTPFDVAQKLSLKESAQETDKFADVVLAASFINSKKILKLSTDEAKKSESFSIINKISSIIFYLLFAVLPILSIYSLYEGFSSSSQVSKLNQDKANLNNSITILKDFQKEYGINPILVNESVKTQELLSQSNSSISSFLTKYKKIDVFSKTVGSIDYEKDPITGKLTITIRTLFDEPNIDNVNEVIFKMSEFEKVIKQEFSEYQVTITGIPLEKELSALVLEKAKNERKEKIFIDTSKPLWTLGIAVEAKFEKQ